METTTKIFKNGNSSAVRISKKIMRELGLHNNDEIQLTVDKKNGNLIISLKPKENDDIEFEKLLNYSMKRDKEALDFLKDR